MILLISEEQNCVYAAFEKPYQAGKYIVKNVYRLDDASIRVFPKAKNVFVFEHKSTMRFFTKSADVLEEIRRIDSREEQYNILISRINKVRTCDWYPELHGKKAGTNAMGYLDHHHVCKCGWCGGMAPGMEPYHLAFSTKPEKTCSCKHPTW